MHLLLGPLLHKHNVLVAGVGFLLLRARGLLLVRILGLAHPRRHALRRQGPQLGSDMETRTSFSLG